LTKDKKTKETPETHVSLGALTYSKTNNPQLKTWNDKQANIIKDQLKKHHQKLSRGFK